MKRRAVLSRAFFRRPGVRALVPDLKLLLTVMTVGCETHVGVYLPAGVCEDAGLDNAAFEGGMATLERNGHVRVDRSTGEVFISSFFRDNTFESPARQRQAVDDFRRIQSAELRKAVLLAVEQSPECGLTLALLKNQSDNDQGEEEAEGEGNRKAAAGGSSVRPRAAASGSRKKGGLLYGVEVWSDEERVEVESLAATHGVDAVRRTAQQVALSRRDGRAFLSGVRSGLSCATKATLIHDQQIAMAENRSAAEAAATEAMRADGVAMKAGKDYLEQRRRRSGAAPA